jgi:RNA polymerase sigma factor (sigma-70 family)
MGIVAKIPTISCSDTLYTQESMMHHRDEPTAETIAREYLHPLFGFSRRRTSNLEAAEELTGEILVEIYDSLRRGHEIRDLSKWVWSIAHHTYARGLNQKEKAISTIAAPPEWLADERTLGPEAEFARKDATAEIRRQVAYLSELHHRIVVLRYFRDRRIREIAAALEIPEGTVKWHLSEIRNSFREEGEEGMSSSTKDTMGTIGCAPERLSVGICGDAGNGVHPSMIVNTRLIPQNILLAASASAKTTQEIARETGIPTPYLADEVKLLHDAELLWKADDNRYVTDFVVTNRAMKGEWYSIVEEVLPWYVETTKSFFEANRDEIVDTVNQIEQIGYQQALWTLIPFAFDPYRMIRPGLADDFAELPARKNGGKWIIMASHTETDRDEFDDQYRFTRMNGVIRRCADDCWSWVLETIWTGFQTHRSNLLNLKWPRVRALIDALAASGLRADSVDDREAELFAALCDSGIISSTNGVCRLEVLWLDRGQLESLGVVMARFHETVRESSLDAYHRFRKIITKHAPPHVRSQIPAVAILPVQLICLFALDELSRTGYLPALSSEERNRAMILLQGEQRISP